MELKDMNAISDLTRNVKIKLGSLLKISKPNLSLLINKVSLYK